MFDVVWNIVFFIIGLGILIAFHEYGHFWTAKKCGVRVQIFKIGFGKSIWSRIGKDGVDYQIGYIPLGGYVKMLDTRNEEVPVSQLSQAFDQQTVGKRAAILIAGPFANFFLAIVLFWIMFLAGKNELIPKVGDVTPNGLFDRAGIVAGDQLTSINDKPIKTWQDFILEALNNIGNNQPIQIGIRKENQFNTTKQISVTTWKETEGSPDILDTFGFTVYKPRVPSIIGKVVEDSPAYRTGIILGDRVLSINGQPAEFWPDLVRLVTSNPGKEVVVVVERDNRQESLNVLLGTQKVRGREIGFIGVQPKVDDTYFESFQIVQYGPIDALSHGIGHTIELIELSWSMLSKLLTGLLSVKNLAGPVSIADGAGTNAKLGLAYFLGFLGAISVNLGFVNLLPIPMLDGGHLVFLAIEKVKGSKLSESVQESALKIGFAIVVSIMLIAVVNDISRYS